MVRILPIVGTRPEGIKMAPVVLALRRYEGELETILCSTGQHRDMLDQALDAFALKPAIELALMQPRQTLASLTARAVTALDEVLTRVRPNMVLVQGDTTTAMAGALAAFYHRIPVGHVEAGLRTDDLYEPFPEEANRRLISTLATLHFPPTSLAADRLRREGVPEDQIVVTGNTVIDALLYVRNKLLALPSGNGTAPIAPPPPGQRRVLLTMHRRESFGPPLERICRAILALVDRNPDVAVIFPVHASPFVREPVDRLLRGHPRVLLSEPLGYEAFVCVLDSCDLLLTDSGGIQEEAPALGKPVLVLREKTERPEAIMAGTAQLIGTDSDQVLAAAERLLHDADAYHAMARAVNPYGDGRASERVVAAIRRYFGLTTERPVPFMSNITMQRLEGAAP